MTLTRLMTEALEKAMRKSDRANVELVQLYKKLEKKRLHHAKRAKEQAEIKAIRLRMLRSQF